MEVETFGSPILNDVRFNDDGTLKQSGKQNVKFYNKKVLEFVARTKKNADGSEVLDENGKVVPDIDPKTGIPFRDPVEMIKEFVRIETRGDTTIIEDKATDLHKRQFYRQYKFFREGKIPDGNPIEEFEFFQPGSLMELHMLGIHTLQQVADMNDLECTQLKDQSGYEVRDIARQWLKVNSPDGQVSRMTKQDNEITKLRREIEELRKNQRGSVYQARTEAMPQVEESPIATMEVNIKDKPRKV